VSSKIPAKAKVREERRRAVNSAKRAPNLDRTQEVAGSSPASSTSKTAANAGFWFSYRAGNDGEVRRGQLLVKLPLAARCDARREETLLLYPMSCPAVE
jgi:hypothetical protein